MKFFNELQILPEDPIFSLPEAFRKDVREKKVDLTVGAFRNEKGDPSPLLAVKKGEKKNLEERKEIEYLPIRGLKDFLEKGEELLFGSSIKAPKKPYFTSLQTLGGTGALRSIGDLLKETGFEKILISDPTWPNHKAIFTRAGLKVDTYSYFDYTTGKLQVKSLLQTIKAMNSKTALLLQPSCHNPTGLNFSLEEWTQVLKAVKKQGIFVVFDIAYQGFGKSLEKDVFPLQLALEEALEFGVAYSFSKNMGLYGERVGFVTLVSFEEESKKKIGSHLSHIARQTYSNPPRWGAEVILQILRDPVLKQEWEWELEGMKGRITSLRKELTTLLNSYKEKDFTFLLDQEGLFAFTRLNKDEIHSLRVEKGIYLPSSGRINLSSLNKSNIEYVANSIIEVLKEV